MKFTGGFIFIANLFVYELLGYEVVLKFYKNLIESFETVPLEYCDNYLDTVEQILKTAGYHLEKRASSSKRFYDDFMDILNKYQNTKGCIALKKNHLIKLLTLIKKNTKMKII
jgi:hypothetical protein